MTDTTHLPHDTSHVHFLFHRNTFSCSSSFLWSACIIIRLIYRHKQFPILYQLKWFNYWEVSFQKKKKLQIQKLIVYDKNAKHFSIPLWHCDEFIKDFKNFWKKFHKSWMPKFATKNLLYFSSALVCLLIYLSNKPDIVWMLALWQIACHITDL